ncbi:DEAD/DEAH box helicase [Desulfonatronospira sp.]|uniref:DEAD/DEAH box helicase n=1 Tax=Desulfonatronospira sp. TaxID=1962951 RepID=UPI0025BE3422|nr:DEAD/DEAH box helicase [Desulfonatronospira sp.]
MQGIDRLLQQMGQADLQGLTLVAVNEIPARTAVYEDISGLPPPLVQALESAGIRSFYSHQARAVNLIRQGQSVVTATPTASGKSLIYNIPVLESIINDPASRALYLFPLKALTRDQLQNLEVLGKALGPDVLMDCAVYDGDTDPQARAGIKRRPPHILLTNPDMLHRSFLPYHRGWQGFFSGLKYIVVDEVHTYRGVMGSNMAWVFRRLKRICAWYGRKPVFVFSSATIANPGALCRALTGQEPQVILEGGAPAGKKHFLLLDSEMQGAAQSAIRILQKALELGLRTIVYTQSRKMTELIAMWASQRAGRLKKYISAYRAGFLPEQRREIENKLASGELLAVVSTSALELGIDIGHLDVCLLVGYPGSVMATMQRGGRVGRSGRDSAIILIGHEDALDQYLLRNPEEFFSLEPESAVINPENPSIMRKHLVCAAAEKPLGLHEDILDTEAEKCIKLLEKDGELISSRDQGFYYTRSRYPHKDVNLRGTGQTYSIFENNTGEFLGEVDGVRAFKETHPGAVYLHMGDTYVVQDLDTETFAVYVSRAKVDYYTRPLIDKYTEIVEVQATRETSAGELSLGRLKVTEQVSAYEKRLVRGQARIGLIPLDLPPLVFETQGIWFTLEDRVRQEIENKRLHFMGGLHALEHGLIGCMPLIILTDRNDLGGIAVPMHQELQRGAVFIYDGTPGGIGLCRQAFELADKLIARAGRVLSSCPCENGCPGCIYSPKCGSGNRPLEKDAAMHLLHALGGEKTGEIKEPAAPAVVGSLDHKTGHEVNRHKSSPKGFSYAVMDVETRHSAQEVGGWSNCHRMGVSFAVVYDSRTLEFNTFDQEQSSDLGAFLEDFSLVVGFNILKFDYRVLQGVSDYDFFSLPSLDILQEVQSRLGHRLSLDHLARHTLGINKTASGMLALKWWKEGSMDRIIDYCRQDVAITRDLYLFGRENGYLLFQNKACKMVRIPVRWQGA